MDTDGIITTISGNGSIGSQRRWRGDNAGHGLLRSAWPSIPAATVYVAEYGTNRIRKIDTAGKITTAIGDGIQGFAGDGGPANKVEMSLPTGVAVDSSGNVYFADSLNNRIRKLAGGNVSTFAGNGVLSRSGDGGRRDQRAVEYAAGRGRGCAPGNLYIADTANNVVRRVGTNGVITNFAGTGTAGHLAAMAARPPARS